MARKKKSIETSPEPVLPFPPVQEAPPNRGAQWIERTAFVMHSLRRACGRLRRQRQERFLRVLDSVPMGDKRFVAVVQAGDQRYLIGATANSMTLLSPLSDRVPDDSAFVSILQQAEARREAIS